VGQRALAAAGRPADQHKLTGVDAQADVAQHRQATQGHAQTVGVHGPRPDGAVGLGGGGWGIDDGWCVHKKCQREN